MKKFLSAMLALLMIFSLAACGQDAEAPAAENETAAPAAEEVKGVTIPDFSIMINGVKVDNVMMVAYPVYSVEATSVNSAGTESTVTYIGFAMSDVLAAAGLAENYVWLEAAADDGYTVEVTGDMVMAPTTLLAVSKNGEQFKTSPWFAPCSSGTTSDYLKGMASILVNTVEGAPEGVDNTAEAPAEDAAEAPAEENAGPEMADKTEKVTFADFCFKVNGKDVTNAELEDLHIYKVKVNVTNKKGETFEVGYTGYRLSDVLEKLGLEGCTAVKAIASDGYETELTPEQIESEYTVIAIEKDKETGEDGTVWVAPCMETENSKYVKLVVEITAE